MPEVFHARFLVSVKSFGPKTFLLAVDEAPRCTREKKPLVHMVREIPGKEYNPKQQLILHKHCLQSLW